MDILQDELAKLHRDATLNQSIQDVDKIIEQLERARESIVAGMRSLFFTVGVAVDTLHLGGGFSGPQAT